MKLTPRLTLAFVFAAVLLTVVALLAYNSGRASLRSATVSDLLSAAIGKQHALEDWVEEKQQDIARLAVDPAVADYSALLIAARPARLNLRMPIGTGCGRFSPASAEASLPT